MREYEIEFNKLAELSHVVAQATRQLEYATNAFRKHPQNFVAMSFVINNTRRELAVPASTAFEIIQLLKERFSSLEQELVAKHRKLKG